MKVRSFLLQTTMAVLLSVATPVIGLALLSSDCEAAVFSGAREIRLEHGAIFDGARLDEGTYTLTWGISRGRDVVDVRLYQGRRMVLGTTGRLIERASPSPYDSVVFARTDSGDRELAEIRFSGSAEAIALVDLAEVAASRR